MDASDPRYAAVQALTAYWLAHPHASDTLEGICQWWKSVAPLPAPLVEQALQWLVEHGVVVAHRAADGRLRYRLADDAKSGPC
jgi:hypothetical protein